MTSRTRGEFFETDDGHLSYELEDLEAAMVFPVASRIQRRFGFAPAKPQAFEPEAQLIDLIRDGVLIAVGWNDWSGLYVMAQDAAGDAWLKEIVADLETAGDDLATGEQVTASAKEQA